MNTYEILGAISLGVAIIGGAFHIAQSDQVTNLLVVGFGGLILGKLCKLGGNQ